MQKLRLKAQSKTKGRIAESIRNPRAEVEDGKVVGKLDWGGVELPPTGKSKIYDLAQIYEYGTNIDLYPINPIGKPIYYPGGKVGGGTRARTKGAKRQFGQNVLHWVAGGKQVFVAYVLKHPGTPAEHFMQYALDEMEREIVEGMADTIKEFGKKKF